ncbi:MAG: YaiI/YqxD family protein [Deltaproteobacteria bacterium]|jgi:hypothetical protein|nr:YaiI/YqxD family protein [Deltaproteobacteria bacterium]
MQIYIDADACPVKDEVYRVAQRYNLKVTLVANSWIKIPDNPMISFELVKAGADAADDWIVDKVEADDVVITADIPLAGRCLEKRARVLGTTGKPFTHDNINDALATRELLAELRESGEITGGPAPHAKKDKSRFLQKLDEIINAPAEDLDWY